MLYVFRSRDDDRTLLLPYNLIRQEVATPLLGRGHALLDDGTLFLLKDGADGPARVHHLQRWQTPYVSDTYAASRPPARARSPGPATPTWCAGSPTAWPWRTAYGT